MEQDLGREGLEQVYETLEEVGLGVGLLGGVAGGDGLA